MFGLGFGDRSSLFGSGFGGRGFLCGLGFGSRGFLLGPGFLFFGSGFGGRGFPCGTVLSVGHFCRQASEYAVVFEVCIGEGLIQKLLGVIKLPFTNKELGFCHRVVRLGLLLSFSRFLSCLREIFLNSSGHPGGDTAG